MAYGLRPVQGSGTGYGYNTGGFSQFKLADDYSGNVFAGDFVELLTTGYVQRQNTTTGESPIIATPTLGVTIGFSWVDATGSPKWGQYYPGGTATVIRAFVCSDPNQIYMIQGDEVMDQSDIGATFLVAGYAASAGSTVIGNSGIYLDSSTQNTTAQTVRCLAIPEDGVNESSSTPNVIVQLLENVSQFDSTTGI
tara:strand:- start:41 stop:625 length:585 start_codon:yes stop_codon:yes gene_type:complete